MLVIIIIVREYYGVPLYVGLLYYGSCFVAS